jgi:hypothetical protein
MFLLLSFVGKKKTLKVKLAYFSSFVAASQSLLLAILLNYLLEPDLSIYHSQRFYVS